MYVPVAGPDRIAPSVRTELIQLACDAETPVTSHSSGRQRDSSMCGRAGDVHARAVPRPKEPRVAAGSERLRLNSCGYVVCLSWVDYVCYLKC